MSNNKQIEKKLQLPHQETIVGINTIQTTPFDNQKITKMSNNKQSSVEWLRQELLKRDMDVSIKDLFEQAKAMHKVEIVNAVDGFPINARHMDGEEYYNETFGGNNEH